MSERSRCCLSLSLAAGVLLALLASAWLMRPADAADAADPLVPVVEVDLVEFNTTWDVVARRPAHEQVIAYRWSDKDNAYRVAGWTWARNIPPATRPRVYWPVDGGWVEVRAHHVRQTNTYSDPEVIDRQRGERPASPLPMGG